MKPIRLPKLPAHERAARGARASVVGVPKPKPAAPAPRVPQFLPKFDPFSGDLIPYGVAE